MNLIRKIRDFFSSGTSSAFREAVEFQLRVRPYLEGVPYWAGAALVGCIAIFYSGSFSIAIQMVQDIYHDNPKILFITSPIFFFLSTWVVEKFAPEAGGTGIPAVLKALSYDTEKDKSNIDRILSLRVALVVVISSLLAVLGAGSLGREGPIVHISACLFYFIGRHSFNLSPFKEHRSWIIAGGAAGVAAAFNAPLAGVVFVLEELAQQHFHQFKTVVISSAIIGGLVSQWVSGKYLYFGYPRIGSVDFMALPWAVVVGVACGIVAFPFHWMLQINWRDKFTNYFHTRIGFSLFTGLCMAGLANFVTPATIGGGVSTIENLLFYDGRADWKLIVGRLLGTVISHLSGCAGGFLAPALSLGAAVGSLTATITNYSSHGLLVLVGMSAFLSAIVGAPFTAWVVVMEMTDKHQAIFPLMLASLIGHGTKRFLVTRYLKK